MLSPLIEKDNDITLKAIGIGMEQLVVKTGPNEWAGLKQGDIVNVNDYREAFEPNGQKRQEGEIVKLKVTRNKELITLDIKVKYGKKERKNVLKWMETKK
jgi:hypothetical protein